MLLLLLINVCGGAKAVVVVLVNAKTSRVATSIEQEHDVFILVLILSFMIVVDVAVVL